MISVQNLTKVYGDFRAVDDITFDCTPGRVTGFLGPNGAGKSTAMRMIVGLTKPTSGAATIDGHQYADIPNPATQVGVLLDASAQHAGRTGREILAMGALAMGLPKTRVSQMLELVGLTDTEAKRRVRDYSLGMRQRLGIANALLGDPKILILDEPANGLDPGGIHWMRELLKHYASGGGTVLLSSHLLHEVQVIADDLIVIGHGKVVAAGSKSELLSSAGTLVRGLDSAALGAALAAAGLAAKAQPDGSFKVDASAEQVGRAAAANAVVLTELRDSDSSSLEELFLELTAPTQRDVLQPAGASK